MAYCTLNKQFHLCLLQNACTDKLSRLDATVVLCYFYLTVHRLGLA